MRNRSVLNGHYVDDDGFRDALVESWKKSSSLPGLPGSDSPVKHVTENMVRAICELDGTDPAELGITAEVLSPVGEAYDCLMREPARMARSCSLEECENLVAEFHDYWRSRRKHGTIYNDWLFDQSSSVLERARTLLAVFFGAAFVSIVPFAVPEAALLFTLSGGRVNIIEYENWCLPIGIAIIFGVLASIWSVWAWPINAWWDRRIKRLPTSKRWLYELATLGSSLISAYVGSFIGFIVSLITRNVSADTISGRHYAIVIVCALLCVLINLMFRAPGDWRSVFGRKYASEDAVRSEWENQIARHVTSSFPMLEVEMNNRTIIRSQGKGNSHYEIDIWIPELKLGIEANGEQYHDHEAYIRDMHDGTSTSREMYKERYCKAMGIKLIHVWSSESIGYVFDIIDYEIGKRMQNVGLHPTA
jgi:hypothetical protein